MERLNLSEPVPERLRGGIIALGNFDGFHLGHQGVVGRAVARAHHERRPALVATFDPHPARFFNADAPPFRLSSLDQRERMFAAAGADAMLVIPFDAMLADMTPQEFVASVLFGRAEPAAVISGHDFTFGRGRSGSPGVLAQLGEQLGFGAEAIAPVHHGAAPVSSSRIRADLAAGNIPSATRLLTRPFAIEGVVEHGDKRGRHLGYPTANLRLSDYQRPAYGIYAVRVRLPDGWETDGVANLGVRPSFDPPVELLETYIFDFEGDLYGQVIEVGLVSYLRAEAKFDDMEALIRQMDVDSAHAREALKDFSRA